MGRACRMNGGQTGLYRVSVGKPEEKRQFGMPKRKGEDIKLSLHKVACGHRVD